VRTDVVLVALSALEQDARTLNLARALRSAGLLVTVVASTTGADHPFDVIPWSDPGGPAWKRTLNLYRFVRTLDVRARVVMGMDLFALGPARSLARGSSFVAGDSSVTPRPSPPAPRSSPPAPRPSPLALVYDMREFYFALGPLQGKGLKQRVLAFYERRLLRSVDRIIVSAPLDAEIVRKHYQLSDMPSVIMNTPPFRERVPSTALRDRFAIPSEHAVALYQGVVHHGRGIAPFLRAMTLMPDVHLCIVGDGPATPELAQIAHDLGLSSRVHWCGSVAYDELHAITCSADVGLCLIEPVSKSYEYALPNKLFEYMVAGVPSVVTDLPALRAQLQQIPAGMLVGRGLAPAEIADAVARVRVPATAEAMRRAAEAVRPLCYDQQAMVAVDLVRELL